jgi:hypothetical protein
LLSCHALMCCVTVAGELLKKGPGQYRVPGVALTQQQPADSQGPADSGVHPSRHPAAGGVSISQRKRPRQYSSQQQPGCGTQGQQRYRNSQYQQQQQFFAGGLEDAGSDDGDEDEDI